MNAGSGPCQAETIDPIRRTRRAPVWFSCRRPVK